MFPRVEPAESTKPVYGEDEDKFEENKHCVEQNQHGVGCNTENRLVRVILQTGGIDEEVSAKESRHTKAEQETFQIDDGLSEENQ